MTTPVARKRRARQCVRTSGHMRMALPAAETENRYSRWAGHSLKSRSFPCSSSSLRAAILPSVPPLIGFHFPGLKVL